MEMGGEKHMRSENGYSIGTQGYTNNESFPLPVILTIDTFPVQCEQMSN